MKGYLLLITAVSVQSDFLRDSITMEALVNQCTATRPPGQLSRCIYTNKLFISRYYSTIRWKLNQAQAENHICGDAETPHRHTECTKSLKIFALSPVYAIDRLDVPSILFMKKHCGKKFKVEDKRKCSTELVYSINKFYEAIERKMSTETAVELVCGHISFSVDKQRCSKLVPFYMSWVVSSAFLIKEFPTVDSHLDWCAQSLDDGVKHCVKELVSCIPKFYEAVKRNKYVEDAVVEICEEVTEQKLHNCTKRYTFLMLAARICLEDGGCILKEDQGGGYVIKFLSPPIKN